MAWLTMLFDIACHVHCEVGFKVVMSCSKSIGKKLMRVARGEL